MKTKTTLNDSSKHQSPTPDACNRNGGQKRSQRGDTAEEIERKLRIAQSAVDRSLHRITVVLVVLVVMCLVIAVIVWWRLLT